MNVIYLEIEIRTEDVNTVWLIIINNMHFLIHSQRNQFLNECLNVSLTNRENAWEPSNTTKPASILNILIYITRKYLNFTIIIFISFNLNIFWNYKEKFTEKYIFMSKLHLFVTNSTFKSILHMFQVSGIWHSL